MGWMDEYNEALKEEKKKKRKQDKKNQSAFMDEYREELDEIAPVAQKEESAPFAPILDEKGLNNSLKNRSWFQAGALSDGYQFGDIYKTFAGTGKDIATDLTAGLLGMGEKAVDTGAYLLGGGAGLIGQDKFQNKMQDFIKKDLYDEEKVARSKITQAILSPPTLIANAIADKVGVDEERDSVMGEKTDSLVQSGGQLLGTVALQAAGVPWFVTSGVTSFGAEAEGALNEGASYGEAGLSAAISAGAEILTEKLFGGSGLGEKGLINLEPLTKGVSSKLVKALADWGVDMMAEGTEEVVSEFAGNLASALYKEENLGQLLFSEDAVDRYIESFIGGAALGGGMNVGKVSNSIKTGRDYRTDLTTNEQKVVDKLYEDAIAEESKNGKVTSKRKAEIYDDIVEQMDKGYISTDKIEEILGGDTYKSYSDTVKNEDSLVEQEKTLTEEFNKLNRKPWRDMTGEEHDRLDELKEQLPKLREQIKANEKTGTRNQLKSQLSTEVSQMVKGDRLSESYNERIRMTQDFKADFDKYKGTKHEDAAKKTLESAVKAGANNSNRVRDLVEIAAQASADTGLTFEFKSGEDIKKDFIARQTAEIAKLEAMERTAEQDQKLQKLKDTLANVESGKTIVNGDISGGNVVLNLDSHKPLNRVVGHEITHSLEPGKGQNTKEYTALKDSLFAYAKTKGIDVDAKLKSLADQYEGVTDANPEAELVADLVGDFLFTDSKYIQNLSTENQNLFQRLWNEVKYLCKIATAGSQEARELARVQKAFEDAYRESGKKSAETQYSLEQVDGIDYVKAEKNIFVKEDGTVASEREIFSSLVGKTISLPDGDVKIVKRLPGKDMYDELVKRRPKRMSEVDNAKQLNTSVNHNMEELLTNSKAKRTNIPDADGKHQKQGISSFDTRTVKFYDGDKAYDIEFSIATLNSGEKVAYAKKFFGYDEEFTKKIQAAEAMGEKSQLNQHPVSDGTIPQAGEEVKRKFSLSDSDGEQLPIEQRLSGDALLDAEDLLAEIEGVAEVSPNGYVTVYHRTTEENAKRILESGKMSAKEDGIFFSTQKDGAYSADYGKGVVELKVPVEKLVLDDIFDTEAHLRIPLKNRNEVMDVSAYLPKSDPDIRRSLSVKDEAIAPGKFDVYGSDFGVKEDIAPVGNPVETVAENTQVNTEVPVATEEAEDIAPVMDEAPPKKFEPWEANGVEKPVSRGTRKELHSNIVENIRSAFFRRGFDFDEVLKKAKNLSTFATVDNTPQRVVEKSLGYKEGQILNDLTVNQVAQNETEKIKWLNSFTDRKSGLLAQISKQYNIKPGSKESAAAQMYAEGYYVTGTGKDGEYVKGKSEIVKYGDAELAADFPDAQVQRNIKSLASDSRIRQIYDDTLAMINESRARNLYPVIPRLDNYFLHFRAMDDTFSRLGLPFNPNDIKAKDLPTDLNGVTADLKPGQPYFASAMHRTGKRTSFDLLGGLERYLTSAGNQIYHIDDIQTLRALRNYIADTYGQANGLEGLDELSEEEAQERIQKVYDSHLSTFAKFLNEEANIIAGKTALIDRGLEGIIGRRGITFLNSVNKQVGSNMVGFNISSSLTNFLPVAQTFAKSNKFDFVKAFAQTVSNKVQSVYGKSDDFAENSPVVIRRKGADRFYRTPYQKVGDVGYIFMSAVDDISTELIARTKYNELTRNGMDSQQAHFETDKWVSRLMGDRSMGQMPQIYNSKMLGLITKFQLEVRNQLDSQFYDTIQEAKVSNEDIENGLARNAKIAAKVGSTFVQLAVVQHLFGKAFESVAGYNPAFDIIETIITAFGWDDEEEEPVLDNIEEAFLGLLEDLPYTSTFTGGRIPISNALPIKELFTGKDEYGNEVHENPVAARLITASKVAPYYVLPGGYGQIKKTVQGLGMFSDDHPISGSYTDSGNLRFPVEDTLGNKIQAGIFGQWASKNARDYFDNAWAPLKEKQIQEFADVGMTIQEYHKYRDGMTGLTKQAEKLEYINGLDLTNEQKNVLKSYLFEEADYAEENPEKYAFLENEGIGYLGWKELDEETKESWSWAFSHQEEYRHLKENGVYPEDYSVYRISMLDFADEANEAYSWAFDNPEKATFGKVFGGGVKEYRQYTSELYDIKADKDEEGKSITDSRKEKVLDYINNLDADYGAKIILFKSEYPADDTYNNDIIDYLNGRDDISYEEMETILKELGFTVDSNGNVSW